MTGASLILLIAVFITATLVTGFATTLFTSSAGASFLTRLWQNTLRFGWVSGLIVTIVFWVMGGR
jgi:hypothetical protein